MSAGFRKAEKAQWRLFVMDCDVRPLVSTAIAVILSFTPTFAQVADYSEAQCKTAKGLWISNSAGVPADGRPVEIRIPGPSGTTLIGGHARAFKQLVDSDWTATCTMSPNQPPSVQNAERRKCTGAPELTVGQCASNSQTPSLACNYINGATAPAAMWVELSGCFLDSKTPFLNSSSDAKAAAPAKQKGK